MKVKKPGIRVAIPAIKKRPAPAAQTGAGQRGIAMATPTEEKISPDLQVLRDLQV
jgi:hypothetical protein